VAHHVGVAGEAARAEDHALARPDGQGLGGGRGDRGRAGLGGRGGGGRVGDDNLDTDDLAGGIEDDLIDAVVEVDRDAVGLGPGLVAADHVAAAPRVAVLDGRVQGAVGLMFSSYSSM
jgi:hypothetical protein